MVKVKNMKVNVFCYKMMLIYGSSALLSLMVLRCL